MSAELLLFVALATHQVRLQATLGAMQNEMVSLAKSCHAYLAPDQDLLLSHVEAVALDLTDEINRSLSKHLGGDVYRGKKRSLTRHMWDYLQKMDEASRQRVVSDVAAADMEYGELGAFLEVRDLAQELSPTHRARAAEVIRDALTHGGFTVTTAAAGAAGISDGAARQLMGLMVKALPFTRMGKQGNSSRLTITDEDAAREWLEKVANTSAQ